MSAEKNDIAYTHEELKAMVRIAATVDGLTMFNALARRLHALDAQTRKMVSDTGLHIRSHTDGRRTELADLLERVEAAKKQGEPQSIAQNHGKTDAARHAAPPRPLDDDWRG